MLIGFGSAVFTLVALCIITFIAACGVGGWEGIVYTNGVDGAASDSPLPMALRQVVGNSNVMYHMLVAIGLFGLIASFHGLVLAAGRTTFEFGRTGYAPRILGKVNSKTHTPAMALLFNMVIGIGAVLTGQTGKIITIACFGALTLYIVSMLAILKLRKTEPDLERPFRVPFYPWFPIIALVIATVSIIAMTIYNLPLAGIFMGLLAVSYLYFHFFVEKESKTQEK